MKILLSILLVMLYVHATAQVDLKKILKHSTQVHIYKTTAAKVEKYMQWDSIPVNDYLSSSPYTVMHRDSIDTKSFPVGHYVQVMIVDNEIISSHFNITNLVSYPINNQRNIMLDVRDVDGNFITNAVVFAGDKKASYQPRNTAYLLRQKIIREELIKVYTPGDTLFLTMEEDDNYFKPIWKQRLENFTQTRIGRIITWLPKKARSIFTKRYRYSYKRSKKEGDGYVLFNQPKYKLTDTVKLKAYIIDKHWNQLKQPLDVFLEYSAKGQSHKQLLARLSPTAPSSYVYSFSLSDTLPSDTWYNIVFKNARGKRLLAKQFSTEDYLLDDIGSYNFRASAENYYPGDSLHFYASAKDANGNNLLDGRVKLVLLSGEVKQFYKDSLYVSDTLFTNEKELATTGETTFSLAASHLPKVDMDITAKAIFINSNNEIQEKTTTLYFTSKLQELSVKLVNDTVHADYLINGKLVTAIGKMMIEGDILEREMKVNFPARIKIDPLAEKYYFTIINKTDTIKESTSVTSQYSPSLVRISKGDTMGFVLYNPYKVPMHYLVLYGNKIIANGKSDSAAIQWQQVISNKRKLLQVKWNYKWAGEDKQGQENIALLYKLLKMEIQHASTVFPGQQDSITITVKDYKDKPARNVDLSAVAYNTQFKNAIDVKEPPYLEKYKSRRTLIRRKHTLDEVGLYERDHLGEHKEWMQKLQVDTMLYYKMLFPDTTFYDVVTPIESYVPQVSVHVVKNGRPQEIYMLYINRELEFYNGVTDQTNAAWQSFQGYTQFGIRLRDQYVELDSIYLQPYYKHHLVIDLDKLPAKAKVVPRPAHLEPQERTLLESQIWQLDNNYITNHGYVWQDEKIVKLQGLRKHLVGPFKPMQPLQFFAPGNFDLNFKFEPRYEYNLSKQVARLERNSIFPYSEKEVPLPLIRKTSWILGDTIVPPPTIYYITSTRTVTYLPYSNYNSHVHRPGNGVLNFTFNDSLNDLQYVVLYSEDTSILNLTLPPFTRQIKNLKPGTYSLLLINKNMKSKEVKVNIEANKKLYLKITATSYETKNQILEALIKAQQKQTVYEPPAIKKEEPKKSNITNGNSNITGYVTDRRGGHGIAGASVTFKGINYGVVTNSSGEFLIPNIAAGIYTLQVNFVGYNSNELTVEISAFETKTITVRLSVASLNLQEVVVVGYSNSRIANMTASTISVRPNAGFFMETTLQGKAAGVNVSGVPGAASNIMIRGVGSLRNENPPLYVIDGILYNELPPHIRPEMMASMEILKDAAATAIYGARAANGAIVITTGAKTQRIKFSDYAIWEPQLTTNAEGKASFQATYPDNITGWQLFVLAMDKKRRIGKGSSFTRAFKPVAAQLSLPQFLVVGDSANVIGKALNHTPDDYTVNTIFTINKKELPRQNFILSANAAKVQNELVYVSTTDTATIEFSLTTTTNFNDGEERKLPVFLQGTEETSGAFIVALADTTFQYTAKQNALPVSLFVQNNTLDVLLEELEHLKRFPYYCMEQTASKLKGLVLEQKIRAKLNQPFKLEKDMNLLLKKLQNAQHFSGAWSWWEKGDSDLYITSYIVEALLHLRQQPLVETNIRNALIYLQSQLPKLHYTRSLQVLTTLSNAGHAMDYKAIIEKIPFDSLDQHQQWQWVRIMRLQRLGGETELKKLVDKGTATMLGGMYWGKENYRWYSNDVATTLIAYSVLENEPLYPNLPNAIIQYFMERKKNGYWRNTVETASIIDAILPKLLDKNKAVNSPTTITVAGDTNLIIRSYPYKTKLPAGGNYTINKSGGGLSYITLYQQWWNNDPKPVEDKFIVETRFENNGSAVQHITAGEKVKMVVTVQVLADAEYAMIHIPIPAGCNYRNRMQDKRNMHKEYLKNKIVLFASSLHKGNHTIEIELEARYTGSFTLNPAKAELMYFPTVYGRNGLKKIHIR